MKGIKIAITAAAIATTGALSAFAAPNASPQRPTAITVYEKPNFRGRSLTFERSVPSLAAVDFNDLAASVKIDGKRDWVLCEHRNFMGKCVRVRAKEKNLKRLKIDGKVSSLYPVRDVPLTAKPR
jgi:Beta/Gamma crystallin